MAKCESSQSSASAFSDSVSSKRGPLVSRRGFLVISSLTPFLILEACSNGNQEVKRIRKEAGIWTKEEIEFLAKSMTSEPQFNSIAFAGSIILDNLANQPSFSKVSPLFTDDPLKVSTVGQVIFSSAGVDIPAPMKTNISGTGTPVEFTLKAKKDGFLQKVTSKAAFQYAGIDIDTDSTKDYTDFLFRFCFAKEVLNAKAFDMVSDHIVNTIISKDYVLPQDSASKKALQAYVLNGSLNGMPLFFMADLWAHFLILPDFKLALDVNNFSQKEAQGDELNIYNLAVGIFEENNILVKKPRGEYTWTNDKNELLNYWESLAMSIYKGLTK